MERGEEYQNRLVNSYSMEKKVMDVKKPQWGDTIITPGFNPGKMKRTISVLARFLVQKS